MRESCKSGSVGEAAGDRRLYPTSALKMPPPDPHRELNHIATPVATDLFNSLLGLPGRLEDQICDRVGLRY